MGLDIKKELTLKYLFLSQEDRAAIEKSLPESVTEELYSVLADLRARGIALDKLQSIGYDALISELNVEGPNDLYKKMLAVLESKATLHNKSVPPKLAAAIRSFFI